MASTSFSLTNQLIGSKFFAQHSRGQHTPRQQLRFSSSYATAERTSSHALRATSLYEVLGVRTAATSQEIKSAYRKLARVLHPDVVKDDEASAADEFMRVQAAYATLSDPEKRAAYDSSLFPSRRRTAAPSVSSYSELAPRWRSWETDQCW